MTLIATQGLKCEGEFMKLYKKQIRNVTII
jgi:hypothetical protein